MDKIKKSQCFEPPKTSGTQKKRFPVKSSECSRYDELVAKLKGWDTPCPFVATEVANEFGITGTDRGHKLKLLTIEVNPAIPNPANNQLNESSREPMFQCLPLLAKRYWLSMVNLRLVYPVCQSLLKRESKGILGQQSHIVVNSLK